MRASGHGTLLKSYGASSLRPPISLRCPAGRIPLLTVQHLLLPACDIPPLAGAAAGGPAGGPGGPAAAPGSLAPRIMQQGWSPSLAALVLGVGPPAGRDPPWQQCWSSSDLPPSLGAAATV